MKATLHIDDAAQRALTKFLFDFDAGKEPDPEVYAQQCPDEESRAKFRLALEQYPHLSRILTQGRKRRERIGPYRVEGRLGRGGMAEVFEVWDNDLQRSLAMKVSDDVRINEDGSIPPGKESRVARFLQEAQITGQLRHPGIVPIHELGIDGNGRFYFTMQLIEEDTLARIFRDRKEGKSSWSDMRTIEILLRVCDAVDFAHAQGILHRDLKPGNIMVGKFGQVYVLDWGLAKFLNPEDALFLGSRLDLAPDGFREEGGGPAPFDELRPLTRDDQLLGTLAYMSPEQARDREHVGPQTDVYSIGAILYEHLSGAPPLNEESLRSMSYDRALERLGSHKPRPLGEIASDQPAELIAICQKAMAPDTTRRYANVRALRADLQAFIDRRVVKAYATGPTAKLGKWIQRNPALFSLAALLLAILSVGLPWHFKRTSDMRLRETLRSDELALGALQGQRKELYTVANAEQEQLARTWLEQVEELRARHTEHAHLSALVMPASFQSRVAALESDQEEVKAAIETFDRNQLDAHWREEWQKAQIAIQDSPRYGFRMEPISGLMPIGENPATGLWEFHCLYSGTPPTLAPEQAGFAYKPADWDPAIRTSAIQHYAIEEETALVYALLPGSDDFYAGSQNEDPFGPNYVDPSYDMSNSEVLTGPIRVEPFLISKYEMTQGQWLRLTGSNPSWYPSGYHIQEKDGVEVSFRHDGQDVTTSVTFDLRTDLRHPVEMVSWEDSKRVLGRIGATLPTVIQWEYAVRAGTDSMWYTGQDQESLRGKLNIADQMVQATKTSADSWFHWQDHNDGHAWHAPVGTYKHFNAFGLYDVHGNVFEWCDDSVPLHDGFIVAGETRVNRATRGGAWNSQAKWCRSAFGGSTPPNTVRASIGLRPAVLFQAR